MEQLILLTLMEWRPCSTCILLGGIFSLMFSWTIYYNPYFEYRVYFKRILKRRQPSLDKKTNVDEVLR